MSVLPKTSPLDTGPARPRLVLVQPSADAALGALWQDVLPGTLVELASAGAHRRKGRPGRRRQALMIAPTLPDAADAIPGSVLSHAVALRRLGFDVALAPVDGGLDRPDQVLARCGIASLGRPVHRSVEEVLQRHADTLDLVVVHGAELARAYEPLIRLHGPAARIVCCLPGLLHPALAQQALEDGRRDQVLAARAVQRQEMLAAYACDATLLLTENDAAVLRALLPGTEVHAASSQETGGEAADPAFRRAVEGQQRLRLAVP